MTSPFSRNSYDVIVVGSGPAGSSAALCLAKEGVRVAVVEKVALPRYKTCGGGVVRRAIRLLPMNIESSVERECSAAELHLLDGDLHFSVQRQQPIVSMTMRERFDYKMVSAAQEAGADVYSKCELLDVCLEGDRARVETTLGQLTARFIVAADGATGVTARKAGWQETRHLVPALECEVWVDDGVLEKFSAVARFDLGLVPHGYAWVFPKKELLSVGLLTTRRSAINLNGLVEQYFKLLGIEKIRKVDRHGLVVPVSPRRGTFVQRRVVLTGDAAGFVDPVAAEGITYAIQSGQLAARALLEGDVQEDRVRQFYDGEVGRSILPELRAGRFLAKLIYGDPRVRTWLFRLCGKELVEAMTDVFMGERSYRGMVGNVLNYFKMLRLMATVRHRR